MVGFIILGVVVVLLAVFLIGIYNSLVQLRQRVQNAWSQVDVQLKRRYDLIPNLVNAVRSTVLREGPLIPNPSAREKASAPNAIAIKE
jgi:LemA protein